MFRFILILTLLLQFANAENTLLIGNWYASSRSFNNDTEVIEKESLHIYQNKNFNITILVSLKKDLAYVKDLRIEVNGTWENREEMLVLVIQTINVPSAKDIYMISQQSLENLAATFKEKYQNNKLYMNKILKLNENELVTEGQSGRQTHYKR